jgi:hypothetical protein
MHGLGFLSAWQDYLNPNHPTVLTPQIVITNPPSGGVQYEGLVEYAFDRLLEFTNPPTFYATNLTSRMITEFGNLGATFSDTSSLANVFYSSGAKALGISMINNATTEGAIQQSLPISSPTNATLPNGNYTLGPPLTLETSFNPFVIGSSLNHVASDLYEQTADFLMRYSTPKGKTLQDLCAAYGTSSDPTYGPFGPGLRYVLAGLGYRVRGGVPMGASVHAVGGNGETGNNGNPASTSGSGGTSKSDASMVRMETHIIVVVYCVWGLWVLLGYGV